MIAFWIVAVLLMAGALLFILTPLLRKDEVAHLHALRDEVNLMVLRDQLHELDADRAAGTIDAAAYESSRQELERRVAEDVQPGTKLAKTVPRKNAVGLLVGLSLPVVAVSLYFLLGNPGGLDPAQTSAPKEAAHEVTEEQIQAMITGLAQRLKDSPDDVQGWSMLARSYNALGRFGEAADAYARLVKLAPGNADMLADYADTLAMSLNKSLQGEPEKLIARALEVDPKNIKALALAGSAAFERRDYPVAITQWKKILAIVPADSDIARSTGDSIGEAQTLAAGKPATAPAPLAVAPAPTNPPTATAPSAPAAAAAEVAGTVELDAALRAQVADTDTVFIFARAAQGPRFPLAVLRKQVKDLPTAFVLDDSMSMVPDAKLSSFPMVVVGARVSKSGSATPTAGDLEGLTEPVRPGAKNLKIRIDAQRK
ncbi:c-type cytochrome biogenesis protein CcmI [Polaromonas sp.]|uniref:c-type cytochrome biogenesis protein CcmI n=1 Tax=Polaromonas sp. TaxID=1869339 RepID=UPI0018524B1B|nr:c-type cytochrome biogenesis protein CcmI [Polaromonas sp.]NMM05039.1 c-type cytochrome biogenesis protein CcmI [Polaromonas sp.]